MTPFVKLDRKPTNEGVKMVKKMCKFEVFFKDRLETAGSEMPLASDTPRVRDDFVIVLDLRTVGSGSGRFTLEMVCRHYVRLVHVQLWGKGARGRIVSLSRHDNFLNYDHDMSAAISRCYHSSIMHSSAKSARAVQTSAVLAPYAIEAPVGVVSLRAIAALVVTARPRLPCFDYL